MASFWDLLPASAVGQPQTSGWPYADPLDPYSRLLPIRQDAGSKAAAPDSAGASAAAAPTQKPLTFWDLLPATPHGQRFVSMMPPTRQPDPWVTPAIRATPVTLGAQAFFPDADGAPSNSGILGPVFGQAAFGGEQAPAARQLAYGGAQAVQPAFASDLRTRLPAMGATAIRPITSYLPTQRQYAQEGFDQMRQGWRDYQHYLTAPQSLANSDQWPAYVSPAIRFAHPALLKMALGAANWLKSPIDAGIHTLIGQPAEDAIGIPSKYTDFAAGLALPFLKRLPGMSGPPIGPVGAPHVKPSTLTGATEAAQGAPAVAPNVGLAASLQRFVRSERISEEEAAAANASASVQEPIQSVRTTAEIERDVVHEAQAVARSPELDHLRSAYANRRPATVNIGDRTVQYEPAFPAGYHGMTNFEGNGFLLGPDALASERDTRAAILHELYRLYTSMRNQGGIHGDLAGYETKAAHAFAERIIKSGVMDQ